MRPRSWIQGQNYLAAAGKGRQASFGRWKTGSNAKAFSGNNLGLLYKSLAHYQ